MDINRLKEFTHLADTFSFAETARHFYMSQSVLSKHIAAMEEELNCKLFVRDSHHVRLTDQGKSFKDDAQGIISQYDKALTRLKAISDSYETVINIGYMRNASRPFLTKFVTTMAQHHPEIRVALCCMEYGEELYSLSTGGIDMAFSLDIDPSAANRCEVLHIYQDRFMAVVPFEHPLAKYNEITVDMLKGYKLLLPDQNVYEKMTDFVERMLPKERSAFRHGVYRDVDTLFLKVETEGYVGFSSEHNTALFSDRVKFISIVDAETSYWVSAFVPKTAVTPEARACLEALAQCRETLERTFAKHAAEGKPRF